MRQTLDFGSWKAMVLCFPFAFLLLATLPQAYTKAVVAKHEKTATGILDQVERNTRGQYRFHFTVDGRAYSGLGHPASRDEAVTGHPVTVFYDARDPNTSALTEYGAESDTNSAIAIFPGLGICGVALMILLIKRNRRKWAGYQPPAWPGPAQ